MAIHIRPAREQHNDDHFVLTAFDSALPYLAAIGSGAQWGTTPFTDKPERVAQMHAFLLQSEHVDRLEDQAREQARPNASSEQEASEQAARKVVASLASQPAAWSKLLIAEAHLNNDNDDDDTNTMVRIAALGLSLVAPDYVLTSPALQHLFASPSRLNKSTPSIAKHTEARKDDDEDDETKTENGPASTGASEPFLYLNYLITHRNPLNTLTSPDPDNDNANDKNVPPSTLSLSKGAGAHLIAHTRTLARTLHLPTVLVDCWAGNGDGLIRYYERAGFCLLSRFDVPDKHGPGLLWTGALLSMEC